MRLLVPLAAALTLLAAAAPASASTFESGSLTFGVSGSWVSTGPVTRSCGGASNTELTYNVTERVKVSGRSKGRIGYQGTVRRSVFFNRIAKYPKVRLTVSRTTSPAVNCAGNPLDCGTRTLNGLAKPEFSGPFRSSGRLDLHVVFARTRAASQFPDPFRDCPLPDTGPGWFADAVDRPVGGTFDWQAKSLGYPKPRGFYARRSRTLKGSVRRQGATLKLKMSLKRKIRVRKPSFAG